MNNNKRILIVAGGTGGHIFPALAVANLCKQHGVDVQWLGSHVGLEKKIVSGKFPIHFIAAKRIRGKSIFTKLLSPGTKTAINNNKPINNKYPLYARHTLMGIRVITHANITPTATKTNWRIT